MDKQKMEIPPEDIDKITMTEKQENLSEEREKMVKALEAMGKSGYVYNRGDCGLFGMIDGVEFEIINRPGGINFLNHRRLTEKQAKEIYEKYRPCSLYSLAEKTGEQDANKEIADYQEKIKKQEEKDATEEDLKKLL